MSDDDPILFTGPIDAPSGLQVPPRPIPVTLAHDWTHPLATATITSGETGLIGELRGLCDARAVAALQAGDAVLAAAWAGDTLYSLGIIPALNKPLDKR